MYMHVCFQYIAAFTLKTFIASPSSGCLGQGNHHVPGGPCGGCGLGGGSSSSGRAGSGSATLLWVTLGSNTQQTMEAFWGLELASSWGQERSLALRSSTNGWSMRLCCGWATGCKEPFGWSITPVTWRERDVPVHWVNKTEKQKSHLPISGLSLNAPYRDQCASQMCCSAQCETAIPLAILKDI